MPNQNPEQIARDNIDAQLAAGGWVVQRKDRINLAANDGVAIREYQTDAGPADYVLFVDKKPVGVIEAKGEDHGFQLTQVEEQSTEYAQSKLKHLNNAHIPCPHTQFCALSQTLRSLSGSFLNAAFELRSSRWCEALQGFVFLDFAAGDG